jgi:hypothetical protein
MLLINETEIIFNGNDDISFEVLTDDLPLYFNSELRLNCTFERFFTLIYLNKEIINLIFQRTLGGHLLDVFYDDMIIPQSDIKLDDEEILMLQWVIDIYENDYTDYVEFYIKAIDPEELHGSIAFMSLSDIKNSQIRICNEITVSKEINEQPIITANKEITLYDAIKGILYEISFNGSPENRKKLEINILEKSANIFSQNDEGVIMTIEELLIKLRTNTESTSNDLNLLDSSKNDNF